MNRSDIIDRVAEAIGDKAAARTAVETTVTEITRALVQGERVYITELGTFNSEVVPSRMVRNPATGKKVRAKKTAKVKFRPTVALRGYVSGARKLPRGNQTKVASTKSSASKATSAVTGKATASTKAAGTRKAAAAKTNGVGASTAKANTTKAGSAKTANTKASTGSKKTTNARSTASR